MNVVLIGPPGAGKGTQAERLEADFRVPRISVEVFRDGAERGAGGSSSDEEEARRVGERLGSPACARGFVLDGFPRTLAQAEILERVLAARGRKLEAVVALEVPEEVLFERLSGRRVCPREGLLHAQSGGSPEHVENRLVEYLREAALLRRFYESRGLWCPVDGEGSVELVQGELLRALANHLSGTVSAFPFPSQRRP